MATKFLEPGTDQDFQNPVNFSFWGINFAGRCTSVSDFVHGGHQRSIKYNTGVFSPLKTNQNNNVVSASGSRVSFYVYFVALPAATNPFFQLFDAGHGNLVAQIELTSAGVLQLYETTNQIGSNGPTLSTGVWYRICLASTITSTTVNRFELFKDGVSAISVTNATITNTTPDSFWLGNLNNVSPDTTLDFRTSDHYADDSASLVDTGDIWVTAKRPFANGTTNGFTTQIGSGGSGYGTGHSPQVNERPLSNTNGWSVIGAGSAVTEEYNIEGKSVGDIDITGKTIVDYMGWLDCDSIASETAQIIVNGVSSNISLPGSSEAVYTKIAGSSSYPAGTGADIGMITSTTVTTVKLYECGIIVAYKPAVATTFEWEQPISQPIMDRYNSIVSV